MIDIRSILLDALEDEYKAEATYAAVLTRFGNIRPFSNIVGAERRHSTAIARQLERLGHPVPANQLMGTIEAPATLAEACSAAIEGEIENIALYDRLLAGMADPEVRQVLENLQRASGENHLPAFRRCLERSQGQRQSRGPGQGRGRGRGKGPDRGRS
jgi:rubrerythrin